MAEDGIPGTLRPHTPQCDLKGQVGGGGQQGVQRAQVEMGKIQVVDDLGQNDPEADPTQSACTCTYGLWRRTCSPSSTRPGCL
jgi:hypothetical protein